jgi:MFS family permease
MIVSFIMPILIIPTLMTLLPVFAKSIYHTGSNGFAVLIMAVGIGNLFGALVTASLGTFERRSVVQMGSLFISASALLAFAFAPNTYVAVPLLFLCGLTQMIFIPTNQTLIQLSVPEEMRGRITTILQVGMLLMPVGMMVAGALADAIGTRTIVGISSATAVVLTVLVWSVSPTIRNIRLSALESRA